MSSVCICSISVSLGVGPTALVVAKYLCGVPCFHEESPIFIWSWSHFSWSCLVFVWSSFFSFGVAQWHFRVGPALAAVAWCLFGVPSVQLRLE